MSNTSLTNIFNMGNSIRCAHREVNDLVHEQKIFLSNLSCQPQNYDDVERRLNDMKKDMKSFVHLLKRINGVITEKNCGRGNHEIHFTILREWCRREESVEIPLQFVGPFASRDEACAWGTEDEAKRGDNPCWNYVPLRGLHSLQPRVIQPYSFKIKPMTDFGFTPISAGWYVRTIQRKSYRYSTEQPLVEVHIDLYGPFSNYADCCSYSTGLDMSTGLETQTVEFKINHEEPFSFVAPESITY